MIEKKEFNEKTEKGYYCIIGAGRASGYIINTYKEYVKIYNNDYFIKYIQTKN